MFRPDPPVDLDYINATYIFDFVDRNKTLILNDPKSIRDFNEKMHTVKFLDLMPENIVTSSKSDIINFLKEHEEIVLKPLNGCFGSGVMTLKKGDKNTAVIINTMTKNQTQLIMVQKYIPKARFGDKRVMFLGDEVLDVCIQKLPSNDDLNLTNTATAILSEQNLRKVKKKNLHLLQKSLISLDFRWSGLMLLMRKL